MTKPNLITEPLSVNGANGLPPVRMVEMSVIDPQAAAQVCKDIEQRLAALPIEVLRDAKRRMAIEAHNAEVERKKAEKKARLG